MGKMFKHVFICLLSMTLFLGARLITYCEDVEFRGVSKGKLEEIKAVANGKSRFLIDGMHRKCLKDRIEDNIKWYLRTGKVNKNYNIYGLDIKDFRNQEDFIDEGELNRWQIHHNNINPQRHRQYAKNKFLFDRYVRTFNSEALPNLYFFVRNGKVEYPEKSQFGNILEALYSLDDGKYFCKPFNGTYGNLIYVINKEAGKLSIVGNEGRISTEAFLNITKRGGFLIQEYITQHKALKKLNSSSVNTIRIVTVRFNDTAHLLSSFLRIGYCNDSIVDNAHHGGICVGVNEDAGTLKKYGLYMKDKLAETVHPISKIEYEGYNIPFYKEAVELVCNLHKQCFPGLSSIGWDVAISDKGPVVVEINSNWDIIAMQMSDGGFKSKWEKLKTL